MGEADQGPLNPLLFELKLLNVSRENAMVELGWNVRDTDLGLLVERVAEGSPVGIGCVATNDYIMSMNGSRTRTKAELDRQINESPLQFRLVIARRRPEKVDMEKIVLLETKERRPGWDYVACRLDTASALSRVRTGMLNGRLAVISLQSRAYAAGIRVGDRVVAIGATKPRSEDHFRRMLHVVRGDPIDVIVERQSVRDSVVDTSEEGNPSTGVPEAPSALENRLKTLRSKIIVSIGVKKEKEKGGKKDSKKSERRATILKPQVDGSKRKQPALDPAKQGGLQHQDTATDAPSKAETKPKDSTPDGTKPDVTRTVGSKQSDPKASDPIQSVPQAGPKPDDQKKEEGGNLVNNARVKGDQ